MLTNKQLEGIEMWEQRKVDIAMITPLQPELLTNMASVPGPPSFHAIIHMTFEPQRKVEGEPGTAWHVMDVKLRQGGHKFTLGGHRTLRQCRFSKCTPRLQTQRIGYMLPQLM